MTKLNFSANKNLYLGVEIEIQLIDPITGNLKPVGIPVLKDLGDEPAARHIKSEIFQSMLEIETPICENAFRVGESLRQSLALARQTAAQHDAQIMMAGTHPYSHYAERQLTPSGRYYSLVDRNKWITRRLQIFGLHVHLGMKDGEHAIRMNNALCHYLPIILALSASSPYWHRDDTGLASSRITFFEAIPTGGHPCLVKDWAGFEDLVERLIASQSISSIKDLWWDIRPNLEFGTIEVRIADCPPTIKEVEALVALIHAVAAVIDAKLDREKIVAPPEWILRENKWRASRHGVQCDLIVSEAGLSRPFLNIWQDLRRDLGPILRKFRYEGFFDFIEQIIQRGPSYIRQRAIYKNGFDEIIRHLVREGERDLPEWPT